MTPPAMPASVMRNGDSDGGVVWNILGQTYRPVQWCEASFAFDTLFPPGTFVPPHIHPTQDEFIRVLEGRFELMLGDKTDTAEAGDLIRLPRGIPHGIFNRSNAPCSRPISQRPDKTAVDHRPRALRRPAPLGLSLSYPPARAGAAAAGGRGGGCSRAIRRPADGHHHAGHGGRRGGAPDTRHGVRLKQPAPLSLPLFPFLSLMGHCGDILSPPPSSPFLSSSSNSHCALKRCELTASTSHHLNICLCQLLRRCLPLPPPPPLGQVRGRHLGHDGQRRQRTPLSLPGRGWK